MYRKLFLALELGAGHFTIVTHSWLPNTKLPKRIVRNQTAESDSTVVIRKMGGGNAQKSAAKRAKNQAKEKKKGAGSQLKVNASANTIVCKVCYNSFMCTASATILAEHAKNKHEKTLTQCFPDVKAK